jgi:hypothetical protein
MDSFWNAALRHQFSATLDMFGNALQACPGELWNAPMWKGIDTPPGLSDFWYIAFHTLFWLDLYLSGSVEGFAPPPPYTLVELDPQGVLPERVYTRRELLSYLDYNRTRCYMTINELTETQALRLCHFPWTKGGISFAELLLDDMRHVQEHGAQLHMFLGQQAGIHSRWVGQVIDDQNTK